MRIGLLSLGDSSSVASWSGTPSFIGRALDEHVGEVRHLGPLRAPSAGLHRVAGRVARGLTGRRSLPLHAPRVAREFGEHAARRIDAESPDAVFLVASSSAISGVPADVPLVYSSDATFRLIEDYYPRYTRLWPSSRRSAESLEREVISRANLLLYPSEWVARSAIEDYGADPRRVHVLPYGANLTAAPAPDDPRPRAVTEPCRLLFVGVDWWQKGAQVAVDTLAALREGGVEAELTICGCTPPRPISAPGLTIIPFLDKRVAAERQRLGDLYAAADFFLMPSRAECYGIVFCEAAAHGLPSLSAATGGIPSAVREGESGHLLAPETATGPGFAALIAEIFADQARHVALRRSSRRAFEEHLSWRSWGRRARPLIEAILRGDEDGDTARDPSWHAPSVPPSHPRSGSDRPA